MDKQPRGRHAAHPPTNKHTTRPQKQRRRASGFARFRKKLYKRHPALRSILPLAGIALGALALAFVGVFGINAVTHRHSAQQPPEAEIAAPPLDTLVGSPEDNDDAPAATTLINAPTPTPTPEPTAEPTPEPPSDAVYHQQAAPAADYANPSVNRLVAIRVYDASGGTQQSAAFMDDGIHMGDSSEYTTLEGVTTFRGSNYRDGGSYGTIPDSPTSMSVVWSKRIGQLDSWSGVGWTGQASIVRWPDELRAQMNITRAKKDNPDLTEVIYATLDGHIYFLDLADGNETRMAINIGAPIKGSLTVDPRGYPLLYCGQGIYDVNGHRVDCGTRIWSLIDQRLLYFLDGNDKYAVRSWRAFDCSPLVDGASDTMITAGENGVLYKVGLNTSWNGANISVSPSVTRYVYKQAAGGKVGTENSVAVYNNYVYFATNIGIIQCVDLNTMALVWNFDAKDDIDASIVIEPESDGVVALYATNEVDNRGNRGTSQMFKLNALTGELLWKRDSASIYQNNDNGGGSFATPAVGKQDLSGIVYFHVARTEDTKGMLYALDKQTGETVWERAMGSYGWSSPTCVYTASGKGYVLVGSSSGKLRLLDGLTGAVAAEIELQGNIEGTPAVFDDMIVIGTRSSIIYGIRIS